MSIGKSSLARAAVVADTGAAAEMRREGNAACGCMQVNAADIRLVKGEKLPAADAALTASIAEIGMAEPLLLAETEQGLLLLGGARRLAAAQAAGITVLTAVVREMTAADAGKLRRGLRKFTAPAAKAPAAEPETCDGITAVGDRMPDWLL